jgi:uncharacterized phiE125 gp8 family phage protein
VIPSLDTAPANPALSWEDEVTGHLRLDPSHEEQARVMGLLVPTVAEWVQALTNRQLITATYLFWFSSFDEALAAACRHPKRYPSNAILVPRPPLQSVTWIKYYDTANVLQTWASSNYTTKTPAGPKASSGWIQPVPAATFPSTYDRPDAVEIKAVCGYGADSTDIPGALRQAMLLLLGEMFERREEAVIGTIVAAAPVQAVNLGLGYLVEV